MFLVFLPKFKYKEITRNKRDVGGSREARVPVEVRFRALGREFHFELEAASEPFTDMSHVLIRRWVFKQIPLFWDTLYVVKVSYTQNGKSRIIQLWRWLNS